MPGGLQHHGPGYITPLMRHLGGRGPEAEQAGRAVQEGPEDAGRVRPGQTQPLHRTVRRHQTVVLTVRQKAIIRNRREAARAVIGIGPIIWHAIILPPLSARGFTLIGVFPRTSSADLAS